METEATDAMIEQTLTATAARSARPRSTSRWPASRQAQRLRGYRSERSDSSHLRRTAPVQASARPGRGQTCRSNVPRSSTRRPEGHRGRREWRRARTGRGMDPVPTGRRARSRRRASGTSTATITSTTVLALGPMIHGHVDAIMTDAVTGAITDIGFTMFSLPHELKGARGGTDRGHGSLQSRTRPVLQALGDGGDPCTPRASHGRPRR